MQFFMIVCVLKWLLAMHIQVEGLDCVMVWKIKVCKQVGVVHVLSMFMGFDMGFFLVGHILDNHNHGMNSQVSKYRGPKPRKSPFSNLDLVWKKGEWHGGTNKISIECAYIPHAHIHEFLEDERGDLHTPEESNI